MGKWVNREAQGKSGRELDVRNEAITISKWGTPIRAEVTRPEDQYLTLSSINPPSLYAI